MARKRCGSFSGKLESPSRRPEAWRKRKGKAWGRIPEPTWEEVVALDMGARDACSRLHLAQGRRARSSGPSFGPCKLDNNGVRRIMKGVLRRICGSN